MRNGFCASILLLFGWLNLAWSAQSTPHDTSLDTRLICDQILNTKFLNNVDFQPVQQIIKFSDTPAFYLKILGDDQYKKNLAKKITSRPLTFAEIAAQYQAGHIANIKELLTTLKAKAYQELEREKIGFRHETNPYFAYTKQATDGRSLHFCDDFESVFETAWTLSLPRTDQTIWSVMNEKARLLLLEAIEFEFKKGIYDQSLTGSCPLQNRDTYQALASSGHRFGFSPLKFFAAAMEGQISGVCRHSNLAMAGLLLELGVLPSNIKVLTGYNKQGDGHLFLEVRTSQYAPWLEYDATAAGRQEISKDFIMNIVTNSHDPFTNWAEISLQFRQVLVTQHLLQRKYANRQTTHPEFSVAR